MGSTLANAKTGGIQYRDIYNFPCIAAGTAKSQIEADINNVGLGNFGTIWLDIETNPIGGWWPGCRWSKTDLVGNCNFITEMINAAQGMGATVGIYSSVDDWGQTVGSSCTAGASLPLWYANYDGQQSYADFSAFGGWTSPSMKQYQDSTPIGSACGISADADWYPGGPPGPSPPAPPPPAPAGGCHQVWPDLCPGNSNCMCSTRAGCVSGLNASHFTTAANDCAGKCYEVIRDQCAGNNLCVKLGNLC